MIAVRGRPGERGSTRRAHAPAAPRGMTLIELLVSIALVAALVGAMSWFLRDLLAIRRQALEASARRDAVTTVMEQLERDLFACVAGDVTLGAGVRGDARRLRILSRDVSARASMRDAAAALADLSATTYVFDPERGVLALDRASALEPAARRPRPRALPGTVAALRFRYHDGTAWRDEFDSAEAGRLPDAVEVAVWFRMRPGVPGGDDARRGRGAPDDPDDPDFGEVADGDDEEDGRLTFDPDAGFDETAFALESDFEGLPPPVPDRLRVIPLLDAAPPDSGEGGAP